jgi:hypothetical protein
VIGGSNICTFIGREASQWIFEDRCHEFVFAKSIYTALIARPGP